MVHYTNVMQRKPGNDKVSIQFIKNDVIINSTIKSMIYFSYMSKMIFNSSVKEKTAIFFACIYMFCHTHIYIHMVGL